MKTPLFEVERLANFTRFTVRYFLFAKNHSCFGLHESSSNCKNHAPRPDDRVIHKHRTSKGGVKQGNRKEEEEQMCGCIKY